MLDQHPRVDAFGIGIVTKPAFDIGVTAVPGPIDEMDWDGWLYHRFINVFASAAIAGGASADHDIAESVSSAVRFEVDSKAMRKLDDEEILFGVLQFFESGVVTSQFSFNSRVLVKHA